MVLKDQKQIDEEGWCEVEAGNIWMPKKEGDFIEGVIITISDEDYGLRATIETPEKKQFILPSHKVLQSRLSNCKIGDYIRVTFKGLELPKIKGRNSTYIYSVMIKKS